MSASIVPADSQITVGPSAPPIILSSEGNIIQGKAVKHMMMIAVVTLMNTRVFFISFISSIGASEHSEHAQARDGLRGVSYPA